MNYANATPLVGPAVGTGTSFAGAPLWVSLVLGTGLIGSGLFVGWRSNRRRKIESKELYNALKGK